jgi:hypothetical protein
MLEPVLMASAVTVAIPRNRLWPILCDTDRANRAIGLAPVKYTVVQGANGESMRMAEMPMMGTTLRWREMPFEWVEGRGFSVQRIFTSGPLKEMVVGCAVEDAPNGASRVEYFGRFQPNSALGTFFARLAGGQTLAKFLRYTRQLEEHLKKENAKPRARFNARSSLNEELLLQRALAITDDIRKRILGKFLDYLRDANDEDLVRMRPFELADRWGEVRTEVLKTFLASTRAGILELKWVPIPTAAAAAQRRSTSTKFRRWAGASRVPRSIR